jgi:hypothetical protein
MDSPYKQHAGLRTHQQAAAPTTRRIIGRPQHPRPRNENSPIVKNAFREKDDFLFSLQKSLTMIFVANDGVFGQKITHMSPGAPSPPPAPPTFRVTTTPIVVVLLT